MKNYNLLTFISLLVIGSSCEGDKKNLFSIDETQFKAFYHPGDEISITVTNKNEKNIDSVSFFNNEKRIGSTKENNNFTYILNQVKLGYQNLKAMVYYEGDVQELIARVEVVAKEEPKLLKYQLVATHPHDLKAYTQGLEFYQGFLYEGTGNGSGVSTGQKGISSLRKTDYKTGAVIDKIELPESIFGEGITFLNNKIYQLTWLNNEGYIYDARTFKKEKTFKYFKKMEGWGLTTDGKNLFMTDSSERISIINPENFKEIDHINVYTNSTKVPAINELEWVNGKIYANIYQKDAIVIINPTSGAVESVIDLSELKNKVTQHPDLDVLNGIAYNPTSKTLFVTGKNWDKMFEIKIIE
ncbi:glutamine cyclotransferase [Flavobacterium columnare]|uniref:glutaminyl-peptide cyclotransferase n=1 Tax=Flavobacterium columnare TaxID=996 RepID=UPI00098134B5|nr:glutaminyl-peptide cyclotransferase [Flavobacterium columnare]OOB84316.1 glutamine cyclotransferase [Flavobacterium columnare]